MMTQEEYMDVMALHREGWSIKNIADAIGRHPATVSGWITNGGPPAKREVKAIDPVIDERWAKSIDEILSANRNLLGTSVMRLLKPQGFEGSYPTLSRHLRQVRGVRSQRTAQCGNGRFLRDRIDQRQLEDNIGARR